MKVGVFFQDNGPVSHGMRGMGLKMLASVRKSMPGVEVFHLTDDGTKAFEGVDGVKRLAPLLSMPMAVRRMSLHASCEGEWLFVDSDVIVQKDVSHVFNEHFDVALTNRDGYSQAEVKFAEAMPYNIGVVFSRSPEFWNCVLDHLKVMRFSHQQWMGDQIAVAGMMKDKNRSGFAVKILPGNIYNYPPYSEDDPNIKDAAIVHYKGMRKEWMRAA